MTEEDLMKKFALLIDAQRKTDEQLSRTESLLAENAMQQRETEAQLAKTDAQLAKTDAQLAKTDKKLQKIAELVGNISNNQGDLTEEFFFKALQRKLVLGGVHYDYVERNRRRKSNRIQDEFDIVLVNGRDVAVVEVKQKAHEKDLQTLITTKKDNFEKLYPEYREYRHHYSLATFYISEDLKERALSQGVIVLERNGDLIDTYLPEHELS